CQSWGLRSRGLLTIGPLRGGGLCFAPKVCRMRSHSWRTTGGFSVVEALVASCLVASAIVGLAHLVAIGAEQSLASRRATSALTIAQSKLEQLRRVEFAYAGDGSRVTSTALALSPLQSLQADTPGHVDHADAFGEIVSPLGPIAPDFSRRWAVLALSGDPDTLVLHVCVFVVRGPSVRDVNPAACTSAIRTRKP
ncbi:MAG: type IV pilus modification PilV family protein, partial [Vicinamibacterales bacterium]